MNQARDIAGELRSYAQNHEMIDQYFTDPGKLCIAAAEALVALVDGVPAGEAGTQEVEKMVEWVEGKRPVMLTPHRAYVERERLMTEKIIATLRFTPALPTRSEVEQAVDRYGDARRSLEKCTDLAPAASWALSVKEARARLLSLIPTREQEKHDDVG
jgi:hypothetical protein